jgi:acyl-CoA thioesterase-1
MMVPPNLGETYTNQFKTIFPSLAEKNQAAYIPFLLEGVAGNPELNLGDGIHPTPDGHKIVAETVWKYLYPLIREDAN